MAEKGDKYEPVRKEGTDKLRAAMTGPRAQEDQFVQGIASHNIDTLVRGLHSKSINGEELSPDEHQTLSEYHAQKANPETPYDGLDRD